MQCRGSVVFVSLFRYFVSRPNRESLSGLEYVLYRRGVGRESCARGQAGECHRARRGSEEKAREVCMKPRSGRTERHRDTFD